MQNILIKRARIINPAKNQDFVGDIYINDGKIAAMGEDLFHMAGKEDIFIDGSGLIAAPGLVDMHVHLRDPGFADKEDMLTAARAAAAGGVTSVLAMPNTRPAVDSPKTVRYILDKARNADVHVYTTACVTKDLMGEELCDIDALHEAGAIALSDDGRPVLNTRHLLEALDLAKKNGMLVCAHCEDLSATGDGKMNLGEISEQLGVEGIPAASEDCGTARDIAAAASINAPIHICHVSTKGSVELIREAKARGLAVTAETAPHYMLLTEKELEKMDADYRMSPPLRREEDRVAILEGLLDKTLDAIATDHAPHTPQEKQDFLNSPNGVIGMETSLAAVLTGMPEGMSLSDVIRLMSTNPASIMKIPAGVLEEGAPADIVIFDQNEKWVVDVDKLHGKSKNAVFKGMTMTGKVKYTICGGRLVYSI